MTTWTPAAKQVETWTPKTNDDEVARRVFSRLVFSPHPVFATVSASGIWTNKAAP